MTKATSAIPDRYASASRIAQTARLPGPSPHPPCAAGMRCRRRPSPARSATSRRCSRSSSSNEAGSGRPSSIEDRASTLARSESASRSSVKPRLPLLLEGAVTLLERLGPHQLSLRPGLVGEGALEIHRRLEVEALLRDGERAGRPPGEPLRPGRGARPEIGAGDDLVQEAGPPGFERVDHLA